MSQKTRKLTIIAWATFILSFLIVVFWRTNTHYPRDIIASISHTYITLIMVVAILSAIMGGFSKPVSNKVAIIFGGILCPVALLLAVSSLFLVTTDSGLSFHKNYAVVYQKDNLDNFELIDGLRFFNPSKEAIDNYQTTGYLKSENEGVSISYAFEGGPLKFYKKYRWGLNSFHLRVQTAIKETIAQSKKDCQGQAYIEWVCHLKDLLKTISLPENTSCHLVYLDLNVVNHVN